METTTYQEIQGLARMTVGELREKYLDVFGEETVVVKKVMRNIKNAWITNPPLMRDATKQCAQYLKDQTNKCESIYHNFMMAIVRYATRLFLRGTGTGETIYTPPPAHDVPIMMAELVDFLSSEGDTHPVLVGGIAQFQLVHIHPFLDGNGRTSRLLSTLYLYRVGYDFKRLFTISEYYDRDRPAFYRAIQGVREAGMDMTGWLEFFVDGLSTQLAEVRERGEQAIRKDVIIKDHNLSDRQALALSHILVHGRVSIQGFERLSTRVSRRTLQRDLKVMIDKGLIIEKASSPTDPTKIYILAGKLSV